jgi:uncharacterized protein YggE
MQLRPLTALLLAGVLAAPAGAQPAPSAPEGTVAGQGMVELKRQSEFLRVQVEILAKGKDLPEALARLKERREAALKRAAGLGAAKETMVLGDPTVGQEKTDQQKQLEAMVAQRLRLQGGKAAAKTKQEVPVVVSAWLRFEVPLKASGPDELLLASQRLRDQIQEADLAGQKEAQKLSPQEEEILEEAQVPQIPGQEAGPKRGEPTFQFITRISEAEVAKALAEAFHKARAEAGQLARAAGMELGPLHRLEAQSAAGSGDEARYSYARLMEQPGRAAPNLPAPEGAEAVGLQPGVVTYRVGVSAAFLLKRPGRQP